MKRWGVQVQLGLHTEVLFQTETYSYSGEARPSLGSSARHGSLTELVSKYEEELGGWRRNTCNPGSGRLMYDIGRRVSEERRQNL